jgi:hypothetical protein
MNKVPEANDLKGLQVKAELSKLGEAPRAYAEHLLRTKENAVMSHHAESGRLPIHQRFAKI